MGRRHDGDEGLGGQLAARRAAIVQGWLRTLQAHGTAIEAHDETRQRLTALADQVIALLVREPLDPVAAEHLGAALVELGIRDPAVFGALQETLGRELLADLPPSPLTSLVPRLISLLNALFAGLLAYQHVAASAELARCHIALGKTEAELRLVAAHAPVILFSFDQYGVLTQCEGRGLASLRHHAADLVGQSLWERAALMPSLAANVQRALAGESFATHVTVGEVLLETHYLPIWEQGAVVAVTGVAVDVTERVRAETTARGMALGLTPAEQRALPFLARQELSYRAIGARLNVAPTTVRTHLLSIAGKLGVPGRREDVVRAAREHGLLPPV